MSKIGIACGRTKESISSEEIVNAVVVVRVGEWGLGVRMECSTKGFYEIFGYFQSFEWIRRWLEC